MDKKLKNPYASIPEYNCFGCSPQNPIGLNMEFIEQGDYIISEWTPKKNFEGWMNVVHGGIQASLMDEIASWIVFRKIGTAGVTRSMEIKYKKPVYASDGVLTIKAKLLTINRNMADIKVELISNSIVKSEAIVRYFLYDEKTARETFLFPGSESF